MNCFSRIFIRKTENPNDADVRARSGRTVGIVGIVLNTLLAAVKIVFGSLSGLLSVTADGLNNLTDCSGNIISIIGFKMSVKPADKEHPFGHRRAEPISSLLIAVLVLFVAFELLTQSIERIFHPQETNFTVALAVVLGVAVLVKLFLFFMTGSVGKTIQSDALQANAADNISDAFATLAVLISAIIGNYTDAHLDGWLGIAVSIFIGITGIRLLKDTVFGLLGTAPDRKTVQAIKECICRFEGVHGVHDLIIHDYGKNYRYATAHVEVDAHMSLTAAHDLADSVEKAVAAETGILLTVHIDPLVLDNPMINQLLNDIVFVVSTVDRSLSVHDFRTVGGKDPKKLVFDIAVPFEFKMSDDEIERSVREGIALLDIHCNVSMTIERQNFI